MLDQLLFALVIVDLIIGLSAAASALGLFDRR
jgi:hypothetical protein